MKSAIATEIRPVAAVRTSEVYRNEIDRVARLETAHINMPVTNVGLEAAIAGSAHDLTVAYACPRHFSRCEIIASSSSCATDTY